MEQRQLYSIKEFTRVFGIGRTSLYAELNRGTLRAVKRGRKTMIPADAAHEWLAGLPSYRGAHRATTA